MSLFTLLFGQERGYMVADMPQLELDILDVGQGDGLVVWLPGGKVMMVDLGSTKNKDIVTESVHSYFRGHTRFGESGGQRLDWLVLTHGDRDHYNMVEGFLTEFQMDLKNVFHGGDEADYKGLIERLRKRKNTDGSCPKIVAKAGHGFFPLAPDLGCEVMVIATGLPACNTNPGYVKNTRSTVLRIVYAGIGLMLTGDATRDTELQVLGALIQAGLNPQEVLAANVLKLAHHGSHRTSNHAGWLRCVNPNYAFVTSDRSGSLDEDQKSTGHRLPQELTLDLVRAYSTRLQRNCVSHPYVRSFETTDYIKYNAEPDLPGHPLPIPTYDKEVQWVDDPSTEGIFSTLAAMGISTDPNDPGANDIGEHWRVVVDDTGGFRIDATRDWSTFTRLGVGP